MFHPHVASIFVLTLFTARYVSAGELPAPAERAAIEAARYQVHPRGLAFEACNPTQGWITRFDARGFLVRSTRSTWTFGLALVGAAATDIQASGTTVALTRGANVSEWWINDERGLEHGLTLRERVRRAPGTKLCLAFENLGNLLAVVADDERALNFVDADGAIVATYAGLVVFDANDRELPARFECGESHVRLVVDDRGAHYPLTIDPIAQQVYFKASNSGPNDRFGASIAMSGNTIVVGAPGEGSGTLDPADESKPNAGAAYVFVRNGTMWTQQAYLKASHPDSGDAFGSAVAISRDTIVIGAPGEDSSALYTNGDELDNSAHDSGAAYVFTRQGSTWTQAAYVKASNARAFDHFGASLAALADTIVVGAPDESSGATGIDGDEASSSAPNAGAVYVLARIGTAWNETAYVKASNTGAGDRFGTSVALAAHTLVVGAPREDSFASGVNGPEANDLAPDSGAAYVFVRSGTTWLQQAYLKASNTDPYDAFGTCVAVAHVPGAALDPAGSGSSTTDGEPQAPPSQGSGAAGHPGSWALTPDVVVVGSPNESSSAAGINGDESNNTLFAAGAAYVFVRNSTAWSQRAYLKAAHAGGGDQFGAAVAITEFGDMIAVGAPKEDGSSCTIGGDVLDDAFLDAGATYVFTKSGPNFTPSTYVKASNPSPGDGFGAAVAVSLATLTVGAPFEDGDAHGVSGLQANESSLDSGASYGFTVASHPAPTSFCAGDGLSQTCPCGNNGAPLSGCANSTSTNGARLESSGRASVSSASDSLVLTAMDVTGPVLFVHGSASNGWSGFNFGDGLMCVSGATTMLALVVPTSGSASLPCSSHPTALHSACGVSQAGGVRAYQAIYRDTASFCSSATFNTTAGLIVTFGG